MLFLETADIHSIWFVLDICLYEANGGYLDKLEKIIGTPVKFKEQGSLDLDLGVD